MVGRLDRRKGLNIHTFGSILVCPFDRPSLSPTLVGLLFLLPWCFLLYSLTCLTNNITNPFSLFVSNTGDHLPFYQDALLTETLTIATPIPSPPSLSIIPYTQSLPTLVPPTLPKKNAPNIPFLLRAAKLPFIRCITVALYSLLYKA